jgi:hypothetical protein
LWSPNIAASGLSGKSIKVKPNTITTYQVIATNTFGNIDTATITITIEMMNPVSISSSNGDIFCVGDSTILNIPLFSGYTYQWLKDDLVILNETTNTLVVHAGADYSVQFSNASACIDTTTAFSIIVPSPIPRGGTF